MNWLITGGCGFIGTRLIRSLVAEGGHGIRVVDNLSVGNGQSLLKLSQVTETTAQSIVGAPIGLELVVADILDEDAMLSVAQGIDVVVHLAANTGVGPSVEDPMADCRNNVLGTLNVLEGARAASVPRFVFASSGAPVGEVDPPIHEELAPRPVSPYGASKLAGEGYCSAYSRCFGVDTVALRFGNVYGPGSEHKQSVVAKFIGLALAEKPIEVYGNGLQTRDFIYIDDLVEAVRLAATTEEVGGEIFQIATNRETTLHELIEVLLPALEANGVSIPEVKHGEKRVGDVMRNYSDTSKAQAQLGWQAKTSLLDGITETVKSSLESNNTSKPE